MSCVGDMQGGIPFGLIQSLTSAQVVNRWGVGHHSWNVPLANYEPMLNVRQTSVPTKKMGELTHSPTMQFIQINLVMYLFAIMFAKLSILMLYHRLFGVNVPFRRAVYAVSAIVVGYCLSLALATIFQCTPPAAVWDLKLRMQTGGKCISLIKIEIAIGGFNIPTDIIILLLPAPMLWRLQMPWSRKLGLMAILATGILYGSAGWCLLSEKANWSFQCLRHGHHSSSDNRLDAA